MGSDITQPERSSRYKSVNGEEVKLLLRLTCRSRLSMVTVRLHAQFSVSGCLSYCSATGSQVERKALLKDATFGLFSVVE